MYYVSAHGVILYIIIIIVIIIIVGEWRVGSEGSRLEAWMKSHKSEVAIT